jgi:hypothetical protein
MDWATSRGMTKTGAIDGIAQSERDFWISAEAPMTL